MQTEFLGDIKSIKQQSGKLIIKTEQAEAHVYIYNTNIIRVNITKNALAEDHSFAVIQKPDAAKISYQDTKDSITINTATLKLHISKSPLRFSFYTVDDNLLSADDSRFGTAWTGEQVINYRKLFPDEKFIGLGEKTGNLDRRGTWKYLYQK